MMEIIRLNKFWKHLNSWKFEYNMPKMLKEIGVDEIQVDTVTNCTKLDLLLSDGLGNTHIEDSCVALSI
jgi:hypothetical protein